MNRLSQSSSKRIFFCLALLLLNACSNTPGRIDVAKQANQQQTLPREYQNALALMQSESYPAAIASLQNFIDHEPGLSGPYINLAIANRAIGNTDAAMAALTTAIELNPDSAIAHQELGILYRAQGQFDAALKAYSRALELDPAYALAHRNIGILYDLYLQRPTLALNHYKKYLDIVQEADSDVARWIADLERRSGATQARAE